MPRSRVFDIAATRVVKPVLGRTLILVAHPDDEALAFGGLLQQIKQPTVVFATDGAPRDEKFWQGHGVREAYAGHRRREAEDALDAAGVLHCEFLGFVDQELHLELSRAHELLCEVVARRQPSAILTLAYEGGHPDHDSCSFLAQLLAQQFGLPVFEAPLYNRATGELRFNEFAAADGSEIAVPLNAEAIAIKQQMVCAYASQAETLAQFDIAAESLRPQPAYDFSRPPHLGPTNYEAWGWPVSSADLCAAFAGVAATSQAWKKMKQTA